MTKLEDRELYYDCIETELGIVIAAASDEGLCYVSFQESNKLINPPEKWIHDTSKMSVVTRQLDQYFTGERKHFDLVLAPTGTDFQKKVWRILTEIPYGETITYGELAYRTGASGASRAVGNANGKNPIVIIQPCHRVVASGGKLGGFSSGLHRKKYLLALERKLPSLF